MTTKKNILLLFQLLLSFTLFSQGFIVSPLSTNQLLIKENSKLKAKSAFKAPSIYDTLNLGTKGLLDDFSKDESYPDTAIWLDNFVFVNRTYGKAPITVGVATFDGLNANGYPYDFLAFSTSSAQADYLTSKPIHLNYPAGDSIYFSFYYQPQGLGNAPQAADSLVLEFKGAGVWTHIWSKKGKTLAVNDSSWTLVMIPVKDAAFLINGFQFRFRNYATLSGNLDHWNLDYVYLNKARNHNDTAFEDISFVYNIPSLINTYTAMPWRHYSTTNMKTGYSTTIRNNHTVVKNGNFSYKINDATGLQVNTTYSGGSYNIDPFITNGYLNYAPFTAPALNYIIPILTGPANYVIESILNSTPDFCRNNDTIRHTQTFTNFYSYDDGSAEVAFGLGGFLNAQMAEKFTSSVDDTLRAIDIYFNPVLTDASLYSFVLNVWNDIGGTPGTPVYTSNTILNPMYNQTGQDQFTRYFLESPLYLNASPFYIGFTQKTMNLLNVGVDKNNNTQSKIFYNVSGIWSNPPEPGSLMMHPVFGSAADLVGVKNSPTGHNAGFSVYPNPAMNQLFLKFNSIHPSGKTSCLVLDLFGRTIIEKDFLGSDPLDISTLPEGVYFVRIVDGISVSTTKFIKQ